MVAVIGANAGYGFIRLIQNVGVNAKMKKLSGKPFICFITGLWGILLAVR